MFNQSAGAPTPAPSPVDWRSEYDKLLFETINGHIVRADELLLSLNRELVVYKKAKNATIKAHIIQEVDTATALLKAAQTHVVTELKRTDLDYMERFLYEKAQDDIGLLLKHYAAIEAAVKAVFCKISSNI